MSANTWWDFVTSKHTFCDSMKTTIDPTAVIVTESSSISSRDKELVVRQREFRLIKKLELWHEFKMWVGQYDELFVYRCAPCLAYIQITRNKKCVVMHCWQLLNNQYINVPRRNMKRGLSTTITTTCLTAIFYRHWPLLNKENNDFRALLACLATGNQAQQTNYWS